MERESVSPDLELARRAAGGDERAFEGLYRRHFRRVYNLCLRMLRNTDEAEDLAQDVFLHLLRKVGTFRGTAAFTTWLHRVTVNRVLLHFRKAALSPVSPEEDNEGRAGGVRGAAVSRSNIPEPDQRLELERAIGQLPEGYRAVLLLYDVEGLDHHEIARELGVSVGTSKSQLHKARRRTRELLMRPVGVVTSPEPVPPALGSREKGSPAASPPNTTPVFGVLTTGRKTV
jgi:RNA polymerase sigma-70 factor (ECF subfamily)